MRFLVCPTAYKGTLSPVEAAKAISEGIQSVYPDAKIVQMPVSDGGNGFLEVLILHSEHVNVACEVYDALMQPIETYFAILPDRTVIIESALICGIANLVRNDPFNASTYGVGEAIKHASQFNPKRVIVGLGGTATTDGGIGLIFALSNSDLMFEDPIPIPPIKPFNFPIIAACDVRNPFCGENGAARVYARQKGASEEQVNHLEFRMQMWRKAYEFSFGIDIQEFPFTGAAGGLAGGMLAALKVELVSGSELVLDMLNFDSALKNTDICITGEGRLDSQTAEGKAIAVVTKRANVAKVPVWAFCGEITSVLPSLSGATKISPFGSRDESLTRTVARELPAIMKSLGLPK